MSTISPLQEWRWSACGFGGARREFTFVLLGIVVYLSGLIGMLFFGDQRYHASLIPVICLLAAPGVAALRDAGTAAVRRRKAGP